MSDIAELVDSLDLDAALARTYRRYDELRGEAKAKRRRRMIAGGVAFAAAAAIAIAVPLAVTGGAKRQSHVPDVAGQPGSSTTTTLDPNAELVVPDGFVLSDDGVIRTLIATTPQPHDSSGGVGVEASSTATERARVVTSSRGPVLRSVTVRFNCIRVPEQIKVVRYEVTPDAVVIDGQLAYNPAAGACSEPDAGPVLTLPLAVPLPAGLPVVAGPI